MEAPHFDESKTGIAALDAYIRLMRAAGSLMGHVDPRIADVTIRRFGDARGAFSSGSVVTG